MLFSPATIVFGASLLGVPICYILNTLKINSSRNDIILNLSDNTIMSIGFICLGLMVFLTYIGIKLIKRGNKYSFDPLFFVFSVCCFSSAVDLLIGLENDGVISGFMAFYLNDGEPYLRSAHGTYICYWDGTGHYIMYIYMLYTLSSGQSVKNCGLYWVGSIAHSLIVFLPGNVIGPYPVKASFILNVPFVIIPIWSAVRFLREKPSVEASGKRIKQTEKSDLLPLLQRPVDIVICIYLIAAIAVSFFRGFVALGCSQWYTQYYEPYIMDPVMYPKLQMLVYLFYFVPYYMMCLYGMVVPGCSWMPDWSLIHAGAAVQAQVAFIGASIHHSTSYQYRVPLTPFAQYIFWTVNLALLIMPQLLAVRTTKQAAFFQKQKLKKKAV